MIGTVSRRRLPGGPRLARSGLDRLAQRGWQRRRVLTGVVAALAATALLVGHDRGFEATVVTMSPGSVWLVSSGRGELTLLDGATPAVVRNVPVAAAGATVAAGQVGPSGFAVDGSLGALTWVDGTTFTPTTRSDILSTATARPQIVVAGSDIYAVAADAGLATWVDPTTLEPRARLTLEVHPPPDGVVTDRAGRLWMTDTASRDVAWIADGVPRHRTDAVSAPGAALGVTEDGPVVVSPSTGRAELLDPESGEVVTSAAVPLRADDKIAVSGGDGDVIQISVGSRGLLIGCSLDLRTCPDVTALDLTGDLGEPVAFGGRIFVPDRSTGWVVVVDPAQHAVVARSQALTRPAPFELLAHDGFLFFNDPAGPEAGVIGLDGAVRRVDKYAPTPVEQASGGAPTEAVPTPRPSDAEASSPTPTPATTPPRPKPAPATRAPVTTQPSSAPAITTRPPATTTPATSSPPRTTGVGEQTSPDPDASVTSTGLSTTTTGSPAAAATNSGSTTTEPGPDTGAPRQRGQIDRFDDPDSGWDSHSGDGGAAGYESGGYRIRSLVPGFAVWSAAPVTELPGAVRMTARARLADGGQGGWGIWAQAPGWTDERYEFSLSHSGSAYVKAPGFESEPFAVAGLDPYAENVMIAEIEPAGDQVHLTLTINETRVFDDTVDGSSIESGTVGIHAFSFSDISGMPLADAHFSQFAVTPLG